jgi:hypothetical protein
VLVLPADRAADLDVQLDLFWQIPARGKFFQVQVTSDSSFRQAFVYDQEGVMTPTVSISNLGNNTLYYWRVRARNAGGYSAWSTVWTFTTRPLPPEVPYLLSPAAYAVNVPRNPQFTWEEAGSAKSYTMQLAADSLFTSLLTDAKGIPFTRYAYSGLTEGGTYWWRVSAQNSAGSSGWSEQRRFTVTPKLPESPLQRSPADGAVNIPVRTSFTWEAAEGADTYTLEISRFADFAAVAREYKDIAALSLTVPEDFTGLSDWYWRISASNAAGTSPWSPVWKFTTAETPLAAPVLQLPVDRATMQPVELELEWLLVTGATSYSVELAADASFTLPLQQQSGITVNGHHVSGLENETTYYWRVRAEDDHRQSAWSDTWSFTTAIPLPGAVTLLEPVDGASASSNEVTFRWSGTGPAVDRYWMERSFEGGLLPLSLIDSTLTDTTVTIVLNAPAPLCRWRVRAGNPAGWGPFSEWHSFDALVVSAEPSPAAAAAPVLDQNYPNPFNPSTVVRFTLPRTMHVRLDVSDLLGRTVRVLFDGEGPAGTHRVVFDASGLPGGMYIVTLRTPGVTVTRVATLLR